MTEEKKCEHKYSTHETKMLAGETKAFCTCKKSETYPLCDVSHAMLVGKEPVIVTAKKDTIIRNCGCGKAKDKMFCDNTCCEDE